MSENLIVVLAICGSMFFLDLVFLGIIFLTQRKVRDAASWPATLGAVTFSTIEMRHSGKGGTTAYPVVRYSYQVKGQPYQSNRVMPGPEVGGTGAGKVVARYPVGAQVMVYYNPTDPSEALLERGTPGHIKWFWIILALTDLFMCGLAVLFFFLL